MRHTPYLFASVGVLLGLSLCSKAVFSGPVLLNANIDYDENHGEDGTDSTFRQTYQLNLENDLSLSNTISITPALRIEHEKDPDQNDSRIIEPQMGVNMATEFDRFSLNSNLTITDRKSSEEEDERYTQTYDISLASKFKQPWPKLDLRFGGTSSKVTEGISDRTNTAIFQLSEDYTISLLKLSYRFNRNLNWAYTEESFTTTDNHDASIDISKNLFDGALAFTVNHQVSLVDRMQEIDVVMDEIIKDPVSISEKASGTDISPDTDWPTGSTTVIGADISSKKDMNLAFSTLSPKVNIIQIYLSSPIDVANRNQFTFQVWASEDKMLNYTQVLPRPMVTYNESITAGNDWFELQTGDITKQYIKVVVTDVPDSQLDPPIIVTDFLVFGTHKATKTGTEKDKSKSRDFRTYFNLTAKPAMNWRISNSFSHALQMVDPGTNRTDLSDNVSVGWSPNKFFQPILSLSQTLTKADDETETTLTKYYTFRVASQPIYTLDLSIGVGRDETYRDTEKDTVGNSLFFTVDSQIFPDLSASANTTFSKNTQLSDGTSSNALTLDLSSNARLTPKLTLDLSCQISSTDTEPLTYEIDLSWRPSDIFSCSVDYTEGTEQTFAIRPSWRPSRAIQLSSALRYEQEEGGSFNLQYKWLISNYLSLNLGYNWDSEAWNWNSRLTGDF